MAADRVIARSAADVGLLSEQCDPRSQRQIGNFPHAFTHVALINSAFNLTRSEKPAEQRSCRGKQQGCLGKPCSHRGKLR